jgi:putative transposase
MDAYCDGALVENARPLALLRRHLEPGLPHHCDRAGQYTCQGYQQRLSSYGIVVSMSRKGDCDDNALMESCYGTLKTECVARQSYQACAPARQSIFESLEIFYNRQRLHSSLGYISPLTYELQLK